jgi:hypothetical protein
MNTQNNVDSRQMSLAKEKNEESKEADHQLRLDEQRIHKMALHTVVYLLPINMYAALVVVLFHLITTQTLMSIGLSVGLTLYIYNSTGDNSDFNGATMNWVLLTFAVITPISVSITLAFQRRERALTSMALIRSTLMELYTAHAVWGWGFKPGEISCERTRSSVDWREHSDEVCREIFTICDNLARWLTLPNATRARHRTTPFGQREAAAILSVANPLYQCVIEGFAHLALLCEVLKREGLPPNEATRVRQWERSTLDNVEILRTLKKYRTPQALRSFGLLFSMFVPPFYAPFYAQLARDLNSIGMAIAFAALTSVALTTLCETVYQLEECVIADGAYCYLHL